MEISHENVLACIDGSESSPAVADYAAWASRRLAAPLTFLHVLDRSEYPTHGNLSGNIGLGSREALLEELATLDEKRGRLALEQGQLMLDAARERARAAGVATPRALQRHGNLVDTLAELEAQIGLLVIGRQGQGGASVGTHIGSHLENVVRTMHRPTLVTTGTYRAPSKVMLAFDGSPSSRKAVEMVASGALFRGLPCHLVMVGTAVSEAEAHLAWAQQTLEDGGLVAARAFLEGDVETALCAYRKQHDIDLLVMGAYGHSRIRQFLVGSTTSRLVRDANVPVLLVRQH